MKLRKNLRFGSSRSKLVNDGNNAGDSVRMSSGDDNEPNDSIIPPVVLEAAMVGSRKSSKKLKKQSTPAIDTTDLNIEVEESSSDQEQQQQSQSEVKRSSLKQSSLGEYFTMPTSSNARWEPLQKQVSEKKKITIRKKRIAVDPPESHKPTKVSSVVTEISSGENSLDEIEHERLKKSVAKARRRSIKRFLVELSRTDCFIIHCPFHVVTFSLCFCSCFSSTFFLSLHYILSTGSLLSTTGTYPL
ncbi:hypothetical protein KIN20_004996 [Parelaphostrongylus tenuis]|uniref:Uncharacterized protein n=1 Tax=Parelaphostrongylus tenuis TaxID=148309 RepID=A0AAD5LZL9_PARTN|nr:hypothetical protein KIN20_004996 [Parelaphostrongylus tenuis]